MYYVMSDIHGSYIQMMKALEHWNSDEEHLVVLGDLIDRGPDSLKVVNELMILKERHPDNVTITKGNHEEMLLAWLMDTPYELLEHYYNPMHRETIMSFIGIDRYRKSSRSQRAKDLIYKNKKELDFMDSLPLYFETDNIIFVHAGIDPQAINWRLSTEYMLWVRNEFIYSKRPPEKRVFFGHTPTSFIHTDNRNHDIWISDDDMKVGIDGGVSMGGQLNVIRVDRDSSVVEELKFI